jgi:hypothetical protein
MARFVRGVPTGTDWYSPSMRRPVRVKTVLFLLLWILGLRAEPPLSPSFHPQPGMSDSRPLQGGRTQFSRCCAYRTSRCRQKDAYC